MMAAGDGLVSMAPTSIAYSGTSASINADGGVDFSAVTSLSLNGVFTSDYDNYLIVVNFDASADNTLTARLRASGTDASGSNYVEQWVQANGSTVNAFRETRDNWTVGYYGQEWNGQTIHMYGPFLAQPTAIRGVNVASTSGARFLDNAATHSLSTAYDGFTVFRSGNTITGNVHVFGYEE